MDILEGLNENQREAVTTVDGPLLIIAGAGSGKTKTLTHRVAFLIKNAGVRPRNILAVTFTNKAAQEMRERIMKILYPEADAKYKYSLYGTADLPMIGTFHAICSMILRSEIEVLGYGKTFNIIDDQDQQALVKKILKQLEIDPQQFNPRAILAAISKEKNELRTAEQFAEQIGGYYEEIVSRVYNAYQKQLKENNSLDFDDIIMLTAQLFQNFPQILEKYQQFFRYIMVDEYQDTNRAQYILINLLASKHRNLCVVGDDWQCFPAGTKIRLADGREKNIENILRQDKLLAAAGQGAVSTQEVTEKKAFPYKRKLLEIKTASGKKILVTSNHLMFAKLSLNADVFYVYLMFKEKSGYRIGIVKGARISKSNQFSVGLNVRANQERAEKMWILKVCKTKQEAQCLEQYYGFLYGIPTLVFLAAGRNMKISQKMLDEIYAKIDTRKRVEKLFADFDLDFEYPHHIPQATIRNGISRVAINLTMFGDRRKGLVNNWGMHRISINSTNKKVEKILNVAGFETRAGKFGDWRYEVMRKKYAEAEKLLKGLCEILPQAVVNKKAILTDSKPFVFFTAANLRETMLVPIFQKRKIVEDKIKSIKQVDYSGKVYDINVSNVHNYIANGVVVHNSIYKFRGADIQNILNFEKDYGETKVIHLEQNYRSSQVILDAAYGVISKNINRKDKKLWTEKESGHLVCSYEAQDERDEAEFIAREISENAKGVFKKFVVLYRTNAQSRTIEEIFLKRSIPYRIIGGIKFYQRKEVKDMVAYLRLILNHSDVISLGRIVNEPRRSIGELTLKKWVGVAKFLQLNPIEVSFQIQNPNFQFPNNFQIPKSKVDEILKFCEFIRRMKEIQPRIKLADFIEKVFKESGYEKMLLSEGPEGEVRWENVKELVSVAQKFDESENEYTDLLSAFLEEVALASDVDNVDQNQDAVHLMTLHSAKGLEFPTVFIVGLEEGILPHARSLLSHGEMEEERRLMYVGLTRAKEKIYLLFTRQRTLFGMAQMNAPSRFLEDIEEKLIEKKSYREKDQSFFNSLLEKNYPVSTGFQNAKKYKGLGEDKIVRKEKDENGFAKVSLKGGERVAHKEFGEGIVVSAVGDVIVVAFKKAGIKRLSAEFAKLKKL
ncbi:MAG: UvrD-helicase domain-containing protein [Candidatus Moranbacteria bacterium]|nr:UvrD-helicase domain-containing protein [Candidatus Moranbacteria bacterium]